MRLILFLTLPFGFESFVFALCHTVRVRVRGEGGGEFEPRNWQL